MLEALATFDPGALLPLARFKMDVTAFTGRLKATKPAGGIPEVLYPGGIEYRTEQRRRKEGVPSKGETWGKLEALARDAGVAHLL